MHNPLDVLAARLFRRPIAGMVPRWHISQIDQPDVDVFPRPLEAKWAVELAQAAERLDAPFEWSDFEGGTRPATKEGRGGRG